MRIDRSVVRKIAAYAAGTVPAAGGRTGGALGVRRGRDLSAPPEAHVVVNGHTVSVSITCGVAYPAPLRETTERVRDHVAYSVAHQTGLDVSRVDVEVRWLARVQTENRPR